MDAVGKLLGRAATDIANEFVRRYASSDADGGGLTAGRDAFDFAREIVDLAVAAVRGEDPPCHRPERDERGARLALDGRPVGEAVDWLRSLERVVSDHFLRGAVDMEVARVGLGRLARLFDQLCDRQLESYVSTSDELAGWYSRVGTDLVSCLVSGAPVETSVVNSQARVLNIQPHQPFRAVAVCHEGIPSTKQWGRVRRRFASLLARYDSRREMLVREGNGLLLAVVPVERTGPRLLDLLTELLHDEELNRTLYVSTGEPSDSLATVGRSCRQALSALEIALYRGHLGRVTQCTEVILEVLLAHNRWVSHRIINTRLAMLAAKPHLLETLRAYIDSDMALQRAAEILQIHPNTVAYRLRQIASMTGRDMRRIVDLAELMVALTALDVVEMSKDQDEGRMDLRARLLSDAPEQVRSVAAV
ncbi:MULTISPECIES: PucR family transcriptional regulator [unclassified Blastococcus]